MGQYLACFESLRRPWQGAFGTRTPRLPTRSAAPTPTRPRRSKSASATDIRLSGPELYQALAQGLNDAGVDVVHLGMVGTEMVYFATGVLRL